MDFIAYISTVHLYFALLINAPFPTHYVSVSCQHPHFYTNINVHENEA
jgi:hypothetical protein